MRRSIAALVLLAAGCAAEVGTGGGTYVPKDSAARCAAHCAEIGMRLTSVVIMASNVGCVCSPAAATARASEEGAAGGMAALMMQRQQQQPPPPPPPPR